MAFGEVLFEEHSSSFKSPYLFNGKELDRETNLTNFGARYLDMKTSLWLNIDPLAEKYPAYSPYVYCINNPLNVIDPDGRDIIFVTGGDNGKPLRNFQYRNGNFYDVQSGKRYNPGKEGVSKTMYNVLTAYRTIEKSGDKILKNQLHTLEKSELHHYVGEGGVGTNEVSAYGVPTSTEKDARVGTQTFYNFSEESKKEFEKSEGVPDSNLSTVVHEMRHQYDYEIGNMGDNVKGGGSATDPAEIRAVNNENRARKIEGLPKRATYGTLIDPKQLNNPPNNKNIIIN
ncbi:TPA: RHS repeat domain-containing protein [Flavobacterium psychrophilum]